ncbi:hypothetical protein E2C01_092104 [Portunus trituberculatus]|uniref:Uncharacterized protein n=1 Tax=Portunus trituberculatus TaxID=210409 RepID=A0A5B7JQH1_PORTR|nr:hypothetical protein [Portunus trituberculatus]
MTRACSSPQEPPPPSPWRPLHLMISLAMRGGRRGGRGGAMEGTVMKGVDDDGFSTPAPHAATPPATPEEGVRHPYSTQPPHHASLHHLRPPDIYIFI